MSSLSWSNFVNNIGIKCSNTGLDHIKKGCVCQSFLSLLSFFDCWRTMRLFWFPFIGIINCIFSTIILFITENVKFKEWSKTWNICTSMGLIVGPTSLDSLDYPELIQQLLLVAPELHHKLLQGTPMVPIHPLELGCLSTTLLHKIYLHVEPLHGFGQNISRDRTSIGLNI